MRRRLLIVEDDEIFPRPLQRSLEIAGYDVLVRPSGEDAMELLKYEDVDGVPHGGEVAEAARHAEIDLASFEEELVRYGLANHER